MRNSSYAFIAAFLVAGWFETETLTAQNICVTTCLDLSFLPTWGQIVAAAIVPILIVLIGLNMRRNENKLMKKQQQQRSGSQSSSSSSSSTPPPDLP